MLLTRIRLFLRRDDGVALAAVLGLMAVSMLLTTAVASSVIVAVGYSSNTRAGVQSQAAAEAGVAAARAGLSAGDCAVHGGAYRSDPGATPAYFATIWTPFGTGWHRACPVDTSTQVRILSTGYADAQAVTTTDSGNTTDIEAILSPGATTTTTTTPPTQINASGPAIYAYSSQGFNGSGTLVSVNGNSPDIMVKTGNVSCSGAASGASDLVVQGGSLALSGSCNIAGNVWSTGSTSISGGVKVGGNVVANGVSISSGAVGGSLWSTGAVTMSGGSSSVAKNVTAASLSFSGGGKVGGNGWVYGATTTDWGVSIAGNLTTKTYSAPAWSSGLVSGTITTTSPSTPGPSPYPTPVMPVVPDWVDFAYHASDWTGFVEVPITSTGTCSAQQVQAAITAHPGTPVVVNALGCAGGVYVGGSSKIAMGADLSIIANTFTMTGSGGFTSTSARRLWMITPDSVADGQPTCPSGSSFSIDGGFTVQSQISLMMYTPCQVVLASGLNLYGQVFAGQAGISGGATLHYATIGLPGYDLWTGHTSTSPPVTTTTTGSDATRTLVSSRNVSDSN